MNQETSAAQIRKAVSSWDGVTIHQHQFGGIEFRIRGREMGHLHGDSLADLPFPKDVSKKLISEGKADPHNFVPQSGWVSRKIDATPESVSQTIELFRMQYERISGSGKK